MVVTLLKGVETVLRLERATRGRWSNDLTRQITNTPLLLYAPPLPPLLLRVALRARRRPTWTSIRGTLTTPALSLEPRWTSQRPPSGSRPRVLMLGLAATAAAVAGGFPWLEAVVLSLAGDGLLPQVRQRQCLLAPTGAARICVRA